MLLTPKGSRNPFADHFSQTLVKLSPATTSDLSSKLKVFRADEIVGFGVPVNDFDPVPKLAPREWHTKMEEPGIVIVDVRNYYETRIGRFVAPGGRFVGPGDTTTLTNTNKEIYTPTETIDPLTRHFTEFPDWVRKNKESLEGRKVLVY